MDQSSEISNFEAAQLQYKRTIRTFARNSVNQLPGYEIEDIESELLIVLWKCVKNYDPNKGASFNTLFQGSARNRIITLIRSANTVGRRCIWVNLDAEAVAFEVEQATSEYSAEDYALANIEVATRPRRRTRKSA